MELKQKNLPSRHPGFTLVEIMVVIVVILLMLGMAVPVLHVITGSQSEAGASNMIAAMLSRARTDAVGLQRPIGVAFIYNPSTNVETMAEVEFPSCQQFTSSTPVTGGTCVYTVSGGLQFYYMMDYSQTGVNSAPNSPTLGSQTSVAGSWLAVGGPPLEIKKDTDLQPLPAGIAVQTICNCTFSNGQRSSDGYLTVGVVLFDGQGRLTSQAYGISSGSLLATSSGLSQDYPVLRQNIHVPGSNQFGVMSQFGLVVFERNEFTGQGFVAADPLYSGTSYTQTEQQQESWLDQNATPLLINRYTGTLVKGE